MLIDDAIHLASQHPESKWFLDSLKQAMVVKIQNVADYIFQSPCEKWDWQRDFPNISPPFETIWFEWRHQAGWGFAEGAAEGFPPRYPMAMLIVSFDRRVYDEAYPDLMKRWTEGSSPDIRWFTLCHFYWDSGDGLECPPMFGWAVSEEGQFRPIKQGLIMEMNPLYYAPPPAQEIVEDAWGLQTFFSIPFMALSFMHCKNVQVVKGPPWNPKLQKARMSRGKPPLVRYRTLVIDPMKAVIASENGGNGALTPKALHICRGHFKDFSKHGLFGKYRGIYWWAMQTRGSAQRGEVKKDYLVKSGAA